MGVDLTRDQSAYGIGQPLIGVPNKPIVSDRNPTANDKASLGQIWVNPTVNTAYILVSVVGNVATWGFYAAPIAGNFVVGGFVQAGTGFVALAGGADITGNSTFHNDVTISGDLMLPGGDLISAGGKIYADDFITTTNPAIGLNLNENGIYADGTDVNVDVSVIPKGDGAFVLDGLWGGVLLSQWRTAQASAQTLDGVQAVLLTLPLAAQEMIVLKATINGFISTYDHALSGDIMISGFRNAAGVSAQIGNKMVSSYVDDGATAGVQVDADIDIAANTIRLLVTGAIGETWNWVTTHSCMYTTHP